MIAMLNRTPDFKTYLTPGQQLASSEWAGGKASESLVVTRVVKDRLGLLHVTLRDDRGREISAFAEQVEAAIAEGHLVPAGELIGSA